MQIPEAHCSHNLTGMRRQQSPQHHLSCACLEDALSLASAEVLLFSWGALTLHSAFNWRSGQKQQLYLKAHWLLAVSRVIHNAAFLILADVVHMYYVAIHGYLGISTCTDDLPSIHRHVMQDLAFAMVSACRPGQHRHRRGSPSKSSLAAALRSCLPCRRLVL